MALGFIENDVFCKWTDENLQYYIDGLHRKQIIPPDEKIEQIIQSDDK